ncbi:hypothetical protein [Acidovorax sp. sic0104]|uniref:hypothetical protein n=1 Tax=Acidovorax sp. sic0104 TaxID=2854784 RepID=UPI001C43E7A8|nr:hypothetical protein [Acidovorax sp. sic0104]MBV7542471.1 hypothetical protein [Acidovorax sp. sic0104]
MALTLLMLPPSGLALQPAAQRVFDALGARGLRFVERHGANQSYDFYWQAHCGAGLGQATCRVRGDLWEPDQPQNSIHVELEEHAGAANALATLQQQLLARGWRLPSAP